MHYDWFIQPDPTLPHPDRLNRSSTWKSSKAALIWSFNSLLTTKLGHSWREGKTLVMFFHMDEDCILYTDNVKNGRLPSQAESRMWLVRSTNLNRDHSITDLLLFAQHTEIYSTQTLRSDTKIHIGH